MTKGTSTVYSFCGPTVIDGKAIRNMMGTTFKTHPYPTTTATWASMSDRSYYDKCHPRDDLLLRKDVGILVAEAVSARPCVSTLFTVTKRMDGRNAASAMASASARSFFCA